MVTIGTQRLASLGDAAVGADRQAILECVIPLARGQYFPTNLSKSLRCVDGTGSATRAQWEPFGMLNSDGSCKHIRVFYEAAIENGSTALSFTEPNGQQRTLEVYPKYAEKTVTFDDTTITGDDYEPGEEFLANLAATRFLIRWLPTETITFSFGIDGATVIREDLADPAKSLVKRYKKFQRSTVNENIWFELVFDVPTAGYGNVRWWWRMGNSLPVHPTDPRYGVAPWSNISVTLTSPVSIAIDGTDAGVCPRVYNKTLYTCGTILESDDYGEWEVMNPVTGTRTFGQTRGTLCDATWIKAQGEIHLIHGITSDIKEDTLEVFKVSPGTFASVTRAYIDGNPVTGGVMDTWGPYKYVRRWTKTGAPRGVTWPDLYDTEADAFASVAYLDKTTVQDRNSAFLNADPFARGIFADMQLFGGATGNHPGYGNSKLQTYAGLAYPFLGHIVRDALTASFRPCNWVYEDGGDWDPRDPLHSTESTGIYPDPVGARQNIGRNRRYKTCVVLWKGRPFRGFTSLGSIERFGKTAAGDDGMSSVNFVKSSLESAGWGTLDKTHGCGTLLMEALLLTGDYHCEVLAQTLGFAYALSAPENVSGISSEALNHYYKWHKVSGTIPRGIGRSARTVAWAYFVTGDEFLKWNMIDRWNTCEAGKGWVAGSSPGIPSDQIGVGLNREYPDFAAGETDSATNPMTDPRTSVVVVEVPAAQDYDDTHPCGDGRSFRQTMLARNSTGADDIRRYIAENSPNQCGFTIQVGQVWMQNIACYGLLAQSNVLFLDGVDPTGTGESAEQTRVAMEMRWLVDKVLRSCLVNSHWFSDYYGVWFQALSGPPLFPYSTTVENVGHPLRPEHQRPMVYGQTPGAGSGYCYLTFSTQRTVDLTNPANIRDNNYLMYAMAGAMYGYERAQHYGDLVWQTRCYDVIRTVLPYYTGGVAGSGEDYHDSGSYGWSQRAVLQHEQDSSSWLNLTEYAHKEYTAPGVAGFKELSSSGVVMTFTDEGELTKIHGLADSGTVMTFGGDSFISVGEEINLSDSGTVMTFGGASNLSVVLGSSIVELADSSTILGFYDNSFLSAGGRNVDLESAGAVMTFSGDATMQVVLGRAPDDTISTGISPFISKQLSYSGKPTPTNMQMYSGDDKIILCRVVDAAGLPVDLSQIDVAIYAIYEDKAKGGKIALKSNKDGGVVVTEAADGQFAIVLNSIDTAGLVGKFYHECEIRIGLRETTVMVGTMDILQSYLT